MQKKIADFEIEKSLLKQKSGYLLYWVGFHLGYYIHDESRIA